MSSEETKILYLTDGMLVREAIIDPTLSKFSIIIIDEIHERSIQSDICLGLALKAQQVRPELKILAMSATIDVNKLCDFLRSDRIHVEAKEYNVLLCHLTEPQMSLIDTVVTAVVQTLLITKNGDFLVFLPGKEEIDDACSILKEKK